jgi:hypothetical protein
MRLSLDKIKTVTYYGKCVPWRKFTYGHKYTVYKERGEQEGSPFYHYLVNDDEGFQWWISSNFFQEHENHG